MDPEGVTAAAAGHHRIAVGGLECIALSDGDRGGGDPMSISADQSPEVVQALLAEHGLDARDGTINVTAMAVRRGDETVLIDAGFGVFSGPDQIQRPGQVVVNLEAAGVPAEDIGLVVISHPHGDHAGGLLRAEGGLTYPNARYVMPRAEWEFWMEGEPNLSGTLIHPGFKEGMKAQARTVLPQIADRLELVDADAEVFPGGRLIPTPGHTPGLVGVEIADAGERLLYLADVFMHPVISIQRPEWRVAMDAQHDVSVATRRHLLERLAGSDEIAFSFHFPFPCFGRVVRRDDGVAWEPIT